MKVLIISTHDKVGGAAKAAYRLHLALLEAGFDSRMLVQFKTSNDPTVIGIDSTASQFYSRLRRFIEKYPSSLLGYNKNSLISLNWLSNKHTLNLITQLQPDIVHLHWINSGILSLTDLTKIECPIVWTLHDMWAFTSGLHVDPEFDETLCPPPVVKMNVLQRLYFRWKKHNYDKIRDLTVVGLSNWITTCSKKSILLSNFKHQNLPNPIDTQLFSPVHKTRARKLLGLKPKGKVLLFGAWNAESDTNKGLHLLKEALQSVSASHTLVLFGEKANILVGDYQQNVIPFGHISDEQMLVNLYSSADVVIVPSLYENLSNSIMEALSCGTPVVAFNVGGNSDLIEHKVNGFLAKPYSCTDLAQGINWILSDNNGIETSSSARLKCLNNFDNKVVADRYKNLYNSILNGR